MNNENGDNQIQIYITNKQVYMIIMRIIYYF